MKKLKDEEFGNGSILHIKRKSVPGTKYFIYSGDVYVGQKYPKSLFAHDVTFRTTSKEKYLEYVKKLIKDSNKSSEIDKNKFEEMINDIEGEDYHYFEDDIFPYEADERQLWRMEKYFRNVFDHYGDGNLVYIDQWDYPEESEYANENFYMEKKVFEFHDDFDEEWTVLEGKIDGKRTIKVLINDEPQYFLIGN